MVNIAKNKSLFLLFLIVFTFFLCKTNVANANGNVYGWAWSSNIGWISFNNLGTTDHDGNPVPAGGGAIDYGVNIDTDTGEISGYAWSENIGWIKFNPEGPYPDGPDYSAKVELSGSYPVTGWARACSVFQSGCSGLLNSNAGGWDGWIQLHNLWIDTSVTPAEFRMWVWGGSNDSADTTNGKAVIGWGIFNCLDETGCATSDHKVVTSFSLNPTNEDPILIQIDSPLLLNETPLSQETFNTSYCFEIVNFGWTYTDPDSDPETKFQFQVADNASFDSPIINIVRCGLNNFPPFKNNQQAYVRISPVEHIENYCSDPADSSNFSDLSYGKTYYWRVKAYDDHGNDSGWVVAAEPFTTPLHKYPNAIYTAELSSPTLINNADNATFIDQSTCYDNNNLSFLCNTLTSSACQAANNGNCYSWWFNYKDETIPVDDTTIAETIMHTYTAVGKYTSKLQVCDNIGCCSSTNELTVKPPLNVPEWQEISPF